MALFGAISQLIPPLALNQITDYMDSYDAGTTEGGVPLVVVVAVGGLFFGQVSPGGCWAISFCFFSLFLLVLLPSLFVVSGNFSILTAYLRPSIEHAAKLYGIVLR